MKFVASSIQVGDVVERTVDGGKMKSTIKSVTRVSDWLLFKTTGKSFACMQPFNPLRGFTVTRDGVLVHPVYS